ncbi:TFG protein [Sarcoptes scabiei]|nr:TFG protein [Sarcoptes scabiei]
MADEKMAEKERKKREIRERLEAQIKSTQKKKGFMTPERKKRLRQLLRRKAADEVKRQQEMKEKERQRVITERTGEQKQLPDDADKLREICKEYHNRIYKLNEDKWDLELHTCIKEYEVCSR